MSLAPASMSFTSKTCAGLSCKHYTRRQIIASDEHQLICPEHQWRRKKFEKPSTPVWPRHHQRLAPGVGGAEGEELEAEERLRPRGWFHRRQLLLPEPGGHRKSGKGNEEELQDGLLRRGFDVIKLFCFSVTRFSRGLYHKTYYDNLRFP